MVLTNIGLHYSVTLLPNSSIVGLHDFKGTLVNIYGIETALKYQPDLQELNSNIVGNTMPQSFLEYELEDDERVIIGESWIDNTVPLTNIITTINMLDIQPAQLELIKKILNAYNIEYNVVVE